MILISIFSFFLTAYTHADSTIKTENHSFRVAIVSCARIQSVNPQRVWSEIEKQRPDLVLLIGDIVYLDERHRQHKSQSMEDIFKKQWQEPNFKRLINKVPYFAIWDDHDAGTNNPYLNTTFEHSKRFFSALNKEARKGFLKRIYNRENIDLYNTIDLDSLTTIRGNIEINQASNFDKLNTIDYAFKMNGVQFVMLDGISSRTFPSHKSGEIISDEQFVWLENTLSQHNGPNILSTGASLELSSSSWGWKKGYKNQYNRLTKILNKHDVTVLTGDIHRNATVEPDGRTRLFHELVSSGAAISQKNQGNYLILDIEKPELNKWDLRYVHRGPRMKKNYEKRSGIITLGR